MTIRTDVTVDWEKSPRLIEVAAPSTSLNAQDASDTLRSLEHKPNPGFDVFSHDYIVEADGKNPLPGGDEVGITLTYQDGQIAFARTSSRCNGTATTGSSTQLIDNTADFVTDGVQRGDWVINFTDQSVTEVLSVIDLNTLEVRPLSDGTDNDFDIGDAYKVWEVADCELGGGNQLAIDSVGGDINPLFTTFGRFGTRTASSSATSTSQESLEAGIFGGVVVVDSINGFEGTDRNSAGYLIGTHRAPAKLMSDALTIAVDQGVKKFLFYENTTLDEDYSAVYVFEAISPNKSIIINPGADVTGCNFYKMTLQGELDGVNLVDSCAINAVTNISGFVNNCSLQSTITMNGETEFIRCVSGVEGAGYATVNPGSNVMKVRGLLGSLGITGATGGTSTIGNSEGQIHFDNTCTGGTFYLRGHPSKPVDDQSQVGCTIISDTAQEANWEYAIEGGYNAQQMMRLIAAAAAGDVVQQTDGSYVIQGIDGSTDRISGESAANNGRNVTALDAA